MSVISSLRRPGHTDESRYLPYTAINVAFVVVVGLAASVLLPVVGLVVLIGDALSAYPRNYVIPDTPSFVPQLVSTVDLAGVFDHGDDTLNRRSESFDANVDPDAVFSTLLNVEVLVEGEDGLFLAVDAREEWESTMATLRKATDEELVETATSAVPFEATVDVEFGGVSLGSPSMPMWVPRSWAIAGAAMLYTVVEYGVGPVAALATTESMRMFIEVYPDCNGLIEGTTTRSYYDGTAGLYDSPEHKILDYADHGAVIYEFPDE